MLFDHIEWDEANLNRATVRATRAEVEQVIANANTAMRHPRYHDRVLIQARTIGGRPLTVVAALTPGGGLRPITVLPETKAKR